MARRAPGRLLTRSLPPPTRMPFRVRSAGRSRRVRYHATLGTYHDHVMLTLMLDGRGRYRNRQYDLEITGGMAGLVFPGPDVGILAADPGDPYDHYYTRFEGTEAVRAAGRISERHGGAPFFACDTWRDLVEPFDRLASLGGTVRFDPPERTLPVDAQLAYLLAVMDEGIVSEGVRLTAAAMRSYMRDHIAEGASLDRMAAHFGVSKAHLCRTGRSALGDTIVHAWTRMKMEWAALLLGDPVTTVGEAASRAGYDDPFYFSRVFKAHFGRSPAAWGRATAR